MSAREREAAAVIVAAGPSENEYIWASLLGRPLLAWTIDPFVRSPMPGPDAAPIAIGRVVLVIPKERLAEAEALCAAEGWASPPRKVFVVAGGPRRRDAMLAGLATLGKGGPLKVVIHDAARPLVTSEMIAAGLAAVEQTGAATAVEPVKETIKRVRDGIAVETLPRERLARVQTPQVFTLETLLAAHAACDPALDPPDDVVLALAASIPVATFPGSPENLKVSSLEDLALAEALLRARVGV